MTYKQFFAQSKLAKCCSQPLKCIGDPNFVFDKFLDPLFSIAKIAKHTNWLISSTAIKVLDIINSLNEALMLKNRVTTEKLKKKNKELILKVKAYNKINKDTI